MSGTEFGLVTFPHTIAQKRTQSSFKNEERLKIISLEKLQKASARKIDKPWGYELIWAQTNQYVAKILFVRAGESLSLQFHEEKEETMFLETGECLFEVGWDQKFLETHTLLPGSIFHLPPKAIHRITAKTDCRIFEVSTPQLHDVVRLSDRYGRA